MTHITYITQIIFITHITYITHTIKSIFKAYEKTDRNIFFQIIFLYIKIPNKYYQRIKERLRKEVRKKYQDLFEGEKHKRRKKPCEKYQTFTEAEKGKKRQFYRKPNRNLFEDQEKRPVYYNRNYYITYNK